MTSYAPRSGAVPIVSEPTREVVEIIEDGGGTVYFGEPLPTYSGSAAIDTTGAQTGQVLTVDVNGVLRPRNRAPITWWLDTPVIPGGALAGDVVALTDGSGRIFEIKET